MLVPQTITRSIQHLRLAIVYYSSMEQHRRRFSPVIIILAVVVLIAVLGVSGWFAYQKFHKPASAKSTNAATKTPTVQVTAPLRDFSSDTYGISLKIPTDWKESKTNPHAAMLIGKDAVNDVEFTLMVSKDIPDVTLACTYVIKDSEDLTYTSPLPGQRSITKLTYTSISPDLKTLCGMMITGNYAAKAGDVLGIKGDLFQAALPTNRIVVNVSKLSSSTEYPTVETALKSPRYTELIAALQSIQLN